MAFPEFQRFYETRAMTAQLVARLDQGQLDFKPGDDRWSVGEVLDHVLGVEALCREAVRDALAGQVRHGSVRARLRAPGLAPAAVPPAWMPWLVPPIAMATAFLPLSIRDALADQRWLKLRHSAATSPRPGRSKEALRADLARATDQIEAVVSAVEAGAVPRLRLYQPMLGRFDLPGLLVLLAAHERRHQRQMADLISDARFPTAGPRAEVRVESVAIQGPQGALAARVHRSAAPRGTVVYAHGFGSGKDDALAVDTAEGLAAAGRAVVRFDMSGLGESDGDFAATTFDGNLADLDAVVRWSIARLPGPLVLVGHSLGAAAALRVACERPEVAAVVVLGTFADPRGFQGALPKGDPTQPQALPTLTINGRTVAVTPELVASLARAEPASDAARMRAPLLVVHGTDDDVIPIAQGEALARAAGDRASFVSLRGVGHRFDRSGESQAALGAVRSWLDHGSAGEGSPGEVSPSDSVAR